MILHGFIWLITATVEDDFKREAFTPPRKWIYFSNDSETSPFFLQPHACTKLNLLVGENSRSTCPLTDSPSIGIVAA
jgi:hypothetical protein